MNNLLGGHTYAASKAGVIQLAEVAAKEGAPKIRVNAIAPGGGQTPLGRYASAKVRSRRVASSVERAREQAP